MTRTIALGTVVRRPHDDGWDGRQRTYAVDGEARQVTQRSVLGPAALPASGDRQEMEATQRAGRFEVTTVAPFS